MFMVLGVAFDWGRRKGLDVFQYLEEHLDNRYKIVLVGTDDNIDKQLSPNIVAIHRTQNQEELAQIYTAADVFVNPTREDNYPTVNIESLACGTPVITFDTDGSPEVIDNSCGSVITVNDLDKLEMEIRRVCENRPFKKNDCVNRGHQLEQGAKFAEYLELYA